MWGKRKPIYQSTDSSLSVFPSYLSCVSRFTHKKTLGSQVDSTMGSNFTGPRTLTQTHKTNELLFIWKQLLEQTHQTNLFRICYWHSARTLWKMKEPLNAFLTPWVVAHHAISYNKKFLYARLPVGVPFFRDTIKSWKHFRCGVTTVCIMHRVINQTSCNSCQKVLSRSGLLHIFSF